VVVADLDAGCSKSVTDRIGAPDFLTGFTGLTGLGEVLLKFSDSVGGG
jgi:hypothetical protein